MMQALGVWMGCDLCMQAATTGKQLPKAWAHEEWLACSVRYGSVEEFGGWSALQEGTPSRQHGLSPASGRRAGNPSGDAG